MTYEAYADSVLEELKEFIKIFAVIPAPSNHEEKRAAFLTDFLKKQGIENVYTDEAMNVIIPVNVTADNDLTVFMAHTDIVFGENVKLNVKEENGRYYCPGIGDDTAKLAMLLYAAFYFLKQNRTPETGILIVGNSGEEGLGNLRGSRCIVDTFGSRIREFYTVDDGIGHAVARAVGSDRYRVTVRTEGGHSFVNFGNRNAIRTMASLIDTLYSVKVPKNGDSITTYNVGGISGGTSVNTIAQDCEMLYEYRSNDLSCIEQMRTMFEKTLDAYRSMGVTVEAELLGQRPCGSQVDPERLAALIEKVRTANKATGYDLVLSKDGGSTDANYPLYKGIPAICVGAGEGRGAHTTGEYIEIGSLRTGLLFLLNLLGLYF